MSFRKVLIAIAVTLVALISIAAIAPFLFKDRILAEVKKVVNKSVNAKVNFKETDITLLKSFPYLGIEINQLTIAGIDSFATDT